MAKSRGRKFAEITSPTSGVFDLTSVPTITNAKLQNSAMTLAGSSVSLGGTGVADTDALSEGSSNVYFTDARVQTFLGGGTLAGNIVVPDNRSIYLGSSSDFRLVHNTTNTQLINATGALQVTSNGGFDVTGAATFSSNITGGGYIAASGNISTGGSGRLRAGASNETQLYFDGSHGHLTNSTGNFTLDVAGDITLDADGADINFQDGGTLFGQISNSSGLYLVSSISDAPMYLRGNDGGSMINAVTIDFQNGANVGIGVTPSASHYKTLELGTVGCGITGRGAADTHILSGLYWDGASTRKYAVSGVAVGTYQITNGAHYWSSPAAGTAGNTATVSANMALLANGNLGIGETSPILALDVLGANNTDHAAASQGTPASVFIRGTDAYNSGYAGGGILFGGHYTSGGAYTTLAGISGIKENTTDGQYGGALIFGTRTNGTGAANMERMRIDSTGNVGIGLTSGISSKLHVNNQIVLGPDASNYGIVNYGSNANQLTFGTKQSGTNYFDTIRITSGTVGIGQTPTGSHMLEITKVGGDGINVNSGADFGGIRLTDNNHSYAIRNASNNFFIYDVTNTTQRVTLNDSGQLGIGTANMHLYDTNSAGVSADLVVANAGHAGIVVASGTGSDAGIFFGDGGGANSYRGAVSYVNSQDRLYFKASGGNKMTLDTNTLNIMGPNLDVGIDSATVNFTDSVSNGNTRYIEIGANGASSLGDALLVCHSSGSGVGYLGYESGNDRLIIACDNGGGNNKIDLSVNAGTGTGGSTDNINGATPALRVHGNGNVGVHGVTTPIADLHVGNGGQEWRTSHGSTNLYIKYQGASYSPQWYAGDPGGILVTSTSSNTTGPDKTGLTLYNNDTTAGGYSPMIVFAKAESGSSPYKAAMAAIYAKAPTGTGNSDSWIDGALVFATAGAATQGTQARMIIDKDGSLIAGGTVNGSVNQVNNTTLHHTGYIWSSRQNGTPVYVNRSGSTGTLIHFHKNNVAIGEIRENGSGVVSLVGFSGAHETSGPADNLPIGTVVSTIDEVDRKEMGDEEGNVSLQPHTAHAKTKVSDTVGDKRVYGVLSEYHPETGKLIIDSVGVGQVLVTGACEGGDLLESNGDGTAKVQDDDIIRSKTIGKVTIGDNTTEVSLVACVLYCG